MLFIEDSHIVYGISIPIFFTADILVEELLRWDVLYYKFDRALPEYCSCFGPPAPFCPSIHPFTVLAVMFLGAERDNKRDTRVQFVALPEIISKVIWNRGDNSSSAPWYYPQRKKKTGVMYEAAIHYFCQGKRAVGIFDYESLYPQRQKTAMVSLTKMGVFWRNYFQSVSPPLFWAHWGKVGRKRLRVWKINISWWAVSDKCATYTDKTQGSFL